MAEPLTPSELGRLLQHRERHPRLTIEKACVVCGKPFTTHRRAARYCSAVCNQRAFRTRKLAQALGVAPAALLDAEHG